MLKSYGVRFVLMFLCSWALVGCSDKNEQTLSGKRIDAYQLAPPLRVDVKTSQLRLHPPLSCEDVSSANQQCPDLDRLKPVMSLNLKAAKNAPASTPVFDGNIIYLLQGNGLVESYDLVTGKMVWQNKYLPQTLGAKNYFFGSITYHNGKLFVSGGVRGLMALDATSGELLWYTPISASVRSAPLVVSDKIIVESVNKNVFALDVNSGAVIWSHWGVRSSEIMPLSSDGPSSWKGYVLTQQGREELRFLDPSVGNEVKVLSLASEFGGYQPEQIASHRGQMLVNNGVVYVMHSNESLIALDLARGSPLWSVKLNVQGGIHLAGELLLVITNGTQVAALHRSSGKVKWICQLPAEIEKSKKLFTWFDPVLINGEVVVTRSDGVLYRLDYNDGTLRAKTKLGMQVDSAPILYKEGLFILSKQKLWQFSAAPEIKKSGI